MLESKDDILSIEDRPTDTVHVAAWDDDVRIRAIGGDTRAKVVEIAGRMERGDATAEDVWDFYAECVVGGVVNSDGKPVFGAPDKEALKKKNGEAIEDIAQAVMQLSGMNPDDIEDAAGN